MSDHEEYGFEICRREACNIDEIHPEDLCPIIKQGRPPKRISAVSKVSPPLAKSTVLDLCGHTNKIYIDNQIGERIAWSCMQCPGKGPYDHAAEELRIAEFRTAELQIATSKRQRTRNEERKTTGRTQRPHTQIPDRRRT